MTMPVATELLLILKQANGGRMESRALAAAVFACLWDLVLYYGN